MRWPVLRHYANFSSERGRDNPESSSPGEVCVLEGPGSDASTIRKLHATFPLRYLAWGVVHTYALCAHPGWPHVALPAALGTCSMRASRDFEIPRPWSIPSRP